jgi:hypothetical protein
MNGLELLMFVQRDHFGIFQSIPKKRRVEDCVSHIAGMKLCKRMLVFSFIAFIV